ncbi:MAG: hypothetical protein EOO38_23685 [Cytophagaceae bacterium]|nr:MAG: hypothetical protein EOO38_23685 [Cytophagaceae bacterium]
MAVRHSTRKPACLTPLLLRSALRRKLRSTFSAKLSRDDIFNMSASLSFYTALSLAPLLILMITFVSMMGPGFAEKMVTEV